MKVRTEEEKLNEKMKQLGAALIKMSPKARTQSYWNEDPEYPVSDWQHEVANDDTRLGYREWVEHQREMDDETGPER